MQANDDRRGLNPWCVIPVYNNCRSVAGVARACREHIDNVLVVDDGSNDADLRAMLSGTGIVVLRHKRNMGKGQALLTALRYLERRRASHMITLDGDGQHCPGDIPRLLNAARGENAVIVLGCRNFNTPHVPGGSRFGRVFSNFWVRLETGLALKDTQSGFRVYPVDLLARLRLSGVRYDFEIEVLARAVWAGATIREEPVRVIYPPPAERVSHFRLFLDNARLTKMHARLIGRRLLPWPHARLVKDAGSVTALSFFKCPLQSLKILLRENTSPGGLAAAAAVGSFLAVLPFIGFHMMVILYASTRLHLNKVTALAVQNLYMPPLTPFLCIQVGFYMRHGRWWTEFTREMLWENIHHRLFEWVLGSLILAPLFAAIAGVAMFLAARFLQQRISRHEKA